LRSWHFSCPAGKSLPLVSQGACHVVVLSLQSFNIHVPLFGSLCVRVSQSCCPAAQLERLWVASKQLKPKTKNPSSYSIDSLIPRPADYRDLVSSGSSRQVEQVKVPARDRGRPPNFYQATLAKGKYLGGLPSLPSPGQRRGIYSEGKGGEGRAHVPLKGERRRWSA